MGVVTKQVNRSAQDDTILRSNIFYLNNILEFVRKHFYWSNIEGKAREQVDKNIFIVDGASPWRHLSKRIQDTQSI